jgi:hypothetical protein
MVSFDDDNAVLKTLVFDQPTAWLAALLERRPHLWQRSWAIEQLAGRTSDPLAAAALARAARGADYFRTRAEAAAALGRFPEGVALPALEVAVRDTSAQVRGAAVNALAGVGGARALAMARDAWRADSSYEVRAAALLVLARLGGAGAREAVLAGLATPSYRDVIQSAALTAALQLQRPDAGLVAAIARQAGAQPLVTTALAALAARGEVDARGTLIESLADRRSWVREWALQAVEQQLEPRAAVGMLREAAARTTRADARAAVEAAIGRLERGGR